MTFLNSAQEPPKSTGRADPDVAAAAERALRPERIDANWSHATAQHVG